MRTLTVSQSTAYPTATFNIPVANGSQTLTLNWHKTGASTGEYELLVQSAGENVKATNFAQKDITKLVTMTLNNPDSTVSSGSTEEETYGLVVVTSHVAEFILSRFTVSSPVFSEFMDILKPKYKTQVATDRLKAEVGGYTYNFGGADHIVATDRESKSLLTANAAKAQQDNTYSFNWKFVDGFATMTATQMIALADAVRQFTQDCFNKEKKAVDLIEALAPTTFTQYKAAITNCETNYVYSKMTLN